MAEAARESPAVAKLARALQIRTVSYLDTSRVDHSEFARWEEYLRDVFPLIHANCTRTKLSDLAYVYLLEGRNPTLDPIALHAHFDVVPAEEPADGWRHPPFGGEIAEGYLWGRGAIDEKGLLITLWQAMEELLASGFRPERSLYLCLGGDEEIGGQNGAGAIAAYLKERGVRLAGLLDEGAFVVDGMVPGRSGPVALIGVAEKGYVNLQVVAEGQGGHSSMPPNETAVGLLGAALRRIERRPYRLRLSPAAVSFFRGLGAVSRFPLNLVFGHPRLFAPLIKAVFSRRAETAALLRTTQAPTTLHGSSAENVLAERAEAVINVRLLHGNTIDEVIERTQRIVADRRVRVGLLPGSDHSDAVPPTSEDSWLYRTLRGVVLECFPEATPIPFLVSGMTDSKHYRDICAAILRFVPFELDSAEIATMHNANERISLENIGRATAFYRQLISACAQ